MVNKKKERRMDIDDIPYENVAAQEKIVISNSPAVYTRAVCVVPAEKTVVAFGRDNGMKRAYAI